MPPDACLPFVLTNKVNVISLKDVLNTVSLCSACLTCNLNCCQMVAGSRRKRMLEAGSVCRGRAAAAAADGLPQKRPEFAIDSKAQPRSHAGTARPSRACPGHVDLISTVHPLPTGQYANQHCISKPHWNVQSHSFITSPFTPQEVSSQGVLSRAPATHV